MNSDFPPTHSEGIVPGIVGIEMVLLPPTRQGGADKSNETKPGEPNAKLQETDHRKQPESSTGATISAVGNTGAAQRSDAGSAPGYRKDRCGIWADDYPGDYGGGDPLPDGSLG